jgi:hypothetical protein
MATSLTSGLAIRKLSVTPIGAPARTTPGPPHQGPPTDGSAWSGATALRRSRRHRHPNTRQRRAHPLGRRHRPTYSRPTGCAQVEADARIGRCALEVMTTAIWTARRRGRRRPRHLQHQVLPALDPSTPHEAPWIEGYFCPSCGARRPSKISLQVGHTGNFLGSRPGTQTLPQSATTGSPDMALSMILFLRT